ncbi:D-xylulose 5-phosphate/D-fructose 6-phosphate phosphoketolase [Meredithblackwellia eburnea MCA 4105]
MNVFKSSDKEGDAPPPQVVPSELSQSPAATIASLAVQLLKPAPIGHDLDSIIAGWRASCFIAAAQIFLKSNAALKEPLTKDHIKPRLLGHWGTTAGLSLVYSHFQALIARKGKLEGDEPRGLFITGPGHGAPAILSELYIEGAITKFYPDYGTNLEGFEKFVRAFSWPGGFPSHINAETPGSIHEGGELGYALSVAYGSVMDNPDLITVVVVGDGESETGSTAAGWHSHKWIDPAESGAVIPVLHRNGFKISERTIPGTMDETELSLLYTGYGYQVRFVSYEPEGPYSMGGNDPADKVMHANFAASIDWAYAEVRKIQKAARSGKPIDKPRWPMIILTSPKGWTGPATNQGQQLLNSYRSHQVPLPAALTDAGELAHLEKWLRSYEPERFFDFNPEAESVIKPILTASIPVTVERRLGFVPEAYAAYKPLELDDWKTMGYKKGDEVSAMKAIGTYLKDVIKRNPKTFRIFSPDELSSNKLDAVFDVTTRNFQWDPETAHKGGRVLEMLSENTLQGWMQGYTLTGRTGLFPSYEAFLGIVGTMLVQYSKFTKMALETKWRSPQASLTYIETSTWTRQEHNGFSHQNPGFVGTVLNLPTHLARVYFPADANTATSVIAHCLQSRNYVNLIVGTKAPTPNFLTIEEAEKHCVAGASVWESYSTDKGVEPDVVLVGIGFELTHEVVAAAAQLKKDFGTDLRVRVVNIVDLLILAPVGEHPHALTEAGFNSLFPPGTPVIINYHGYPSQLTGLLFNRPHTVGRARFHISGYSEQGSTTTPWLMLHVNKCSRFDVATKAIEYVVTNFTTLDNIKGEEKRLRVGKVVAKAHETISHYAHLTTEMVKYAEKTQQDHPDIGAVQTLTEG